jgi:mono/diheme cytochrome c family protein
MKKLLKIVVFLVVIVVVVAAAGGAYLFARYPDVPDPETVTVQSTPERLARGEYLVKHVTGCVECHSIRDMTKYAGPVQPGTEGAGGEFFGDEAQGLAIYSRNITPEGIGSWTDGELIRAMTTGVNAKGEPLFPIMPYLRYANLAREDVEAIVTYIRTLKPVKSSVRERRLPFPLPLVVRTMPKPATLAPMPSRRDKWAYGKYLVNAASCAECHTPVDAQGQPLPGRDFAGGREFPLTGGGVVRTANITPDADTGLGTWTEQMFIEKFKLWRAMPPRLLTAAEQRENTIMPWYMYAGMTAEDLSAIYTYLRTVKPNVNQVRKFN